MNLSLQLPPCLSALELHKAIQEVVEHEGHPGGRGASALWAWDLPTSDSAFPQQFRLGRRRPWRHPAAQAHNFGRNSIF